MPTHTTIRRFLTGTGISLMLFLVPLTAAAQGNSFAVTTQSGIASVMTFLIAGLNLLTWIFFLMLSILLDPQFMFGTADNNSFELVLNAIWVLSRDLMNIGFALILIGAAVYTIVTAKKGVAADHLKHFVLCVVLVNFSWFIPRIILDIANVSAAVVYGIPSLLVSNDSAKACTFTSRKSMAADGLTCSGPADGIYTCTCALVTDARFFLKSTDARTLDEGGWYCPLGSTFCVKMRDLDVHAVAGHSAVLNGLIVNHARLQGLAVVPKPQPGVSEVEGTIMFLLSSVITFATHIALFFPLAAMTFAFAIRIPVLWLTIAFMPFALLKFVLPAEYIGDYPQKIWDHFLKAAFLPAIVGVPLSVGFILVNAFNTVASVSTNPFSRISFTAAGVNNFYQLLWQGMTLGVLWVGVFAALEKMGPILGAGSSFFKSMGKAVGGIALKLPLSVPIPGPAGGTGITPLSMLKKIDPRRLNYALSNSDDGIAGMFRSKEGGKLEIAAAADKLAAKNAADFQKLNTSLSLILEEMRRGNTNNANSGIEKDINTTFNLSTANKVNSGNLDQFLTKLKKEMERKRAPRERVTDIENHIKKLAKIKKDTPPAAQSAAAPPPTAPAAARQAPQAVGAGTAPAGAQPAQQAPVAGAGTAAPGGLAPAAVKPAQAKPETPPQAGTAPTP